MLNCDPLLTATPLLDFETPAISGLITERRWPDLPIEDRIGAIYDFVRNEIAFGYNRADDIPASEVLANGYGQCNTKGTLLMALFRGSGIRCRLHGFAIHKELQRGVVPELFYPIAPTEIVHSWVEVEAEGTWLKLEGFILDELFLRVLQQTFPKTESLCGYGVGTDCLSDPQVEWEGRDTYIQRNGIVQDFGVFDSPDSFYVRHRQNFGFFRELMYRVVVRHWMNARVRALRTGRLVANISATHSHGNSGESV
ncbi:transglutaminase-like domain-containing protein [Ruegeria faecimaris]|uniref:transglutaminase-like domain-containing protein n=1 Tax=Ruegeria faecimaris TaxID=686389 RepID=UPI00232C4515|nr:transglutaminase family protein [Ruegeria faecimaris]